MINSFADKNLLVVNASNFPLYTFILYTCPVALIVLVKVK